MTETGVMNQPVVGPRNVMPASAAATISTTRRRYSANETPLRSLSILHFASRNVLPVAPHRTGSTSWTARAAGIVPWDWGTDTLPPDRGSSARCGVVGAPAGGAVRFAEARPARHFVAAAIDGEGAAGVEWAARRHLEDLRRLAANDR